MLIRTQKAAFREVAIDSSGPKHLDVLIMLSFVRVKTLYPDETIKSLLNPKKFAIHSSCAELFRESIGQVWRVLRFSVFIE